MAKSICNTCTYCKKRNTWLNCKCTKYNHRNAECWKWNEIELIILSGTSQVIVKAWFEEISTYPVMRPGPQFNIKMTSYLYRKSHCGDNTILPPSYLHNWISFTGKTTSLYLIRALNILDKDQYHGYWCPGPLVLPGYQQPWCSLHSITQTKSQAQLESANEKWHGRF